MMKEYHHKFETGGFMTAKRQLFFVTGLILLLLVASFAITAAQDTACNPAIDYDAQGDILYAQGDFVGSIAAFNCVLSARPNSAATYNARGNAYRELGNFAQALADYNRAIEIDSTVSIFYSNRGYVEYKAGSLTQALADFNQAVAIDPNLAYAYNNRGLVYAAQGNNQQAIADFNTAISLGHEPVDWPTKNLASMGFTPAENPPIVEVIPQQPVPAPDWTADLLEGQTAYRAENYEAAIAAFTRAIEADPTNAYLFCERAAAYYMMGDYESAVADYTQAIELGHAAFHYTWRGNSYANLGENDKAFADYQDAIKADPTFWNAYLFRGLLYFRTSDNTAARADFIQWKQGNESHIVQQELPEMGETITLDSTNGQFYSISIPVEKGQVLNIETTTPDRSGADPMIVLADGNLPFYVNDDGGAGLNAILKDFVIQTTCNYTLFITNPGLGDAIGLTINLATP
jgi:tetratricopeptide (TPR) repeat protein